MMPPHSTLALVTWDQLQQQLGLSKSSVAKTSRPILAAPTMPSATLEQLMQQSCKDGERTVHLTRIAGSLLASGFDLDESIEHCHRWNQINTPPLDNDKIESTCESIHSIDQRNHPERYQRLLPIAPLFELSAGRIDHYLSTKPPARRWLLKDLVVLGKVGAIIAPGGSSKSQWLLQLAVGVASGVPVADHWEVGETGGVLVFFAEDDGDEIHRRIKRVQDHLLLAGHADKLAGMEDRLYIFSTIGTDTLLTKRDTSGEVSATPIVDRINALAEQVPDLRLIVIDPASRFRGGEENSNEDATRFVEALETLAKKTGATVMLAHHTNKGSYNSDGEPGQGASRGASALTDGLRWLMNLGRISDRQATAIGAGKEVLGKYVAATVTKTNYSAFPDPVLLERCDDGYLTAVSPAHAKQHAEQDAIVRVLRVLQHDGKPMTARHLEDYHGGIGGPLKMAKQQVREVVKLAVSRGHLEGGDRKPLTVTDHGLNILRCFPAPAEVAPLAPKTPPRKKLQ